MQVGLAAHRGQFFHLGGGLFGGDADRVEAVAEDYTEGGEVVVTAELAAQCNGEFRLAPRQDVPRALGENLRVTEGPRRLDIVATDLRYPIPYSENFYADLLKFASRPGDTALLEQTHAAHGRRRAVVLIERERDEDDAPEVAVLNELALSLAMKKIGMEAMRQFGGTEIKTSGSLGIYTFDECSPALAFAKRFREARSCGRVSPAGSGSIMAKCWCSNWTMGPRTSPAPP